MKKDVAINLFGLVAMFIGFALYLLKYYVPAMIFTFMGIGVYIYNKFKKKD